MLVGRHAVEALQHLVAFDRKAAFVPRDDLKVSCSKPNACARRRRRRARLTISRCSSVSAEGLAGAPADDRAPRSSICEEIARRQRAFVRGARRDREPQRTAARRPR